jgi:hypothetical protein
MDIPAKNNSSIRIAEEKEQAMGDILRQVILLFLQDFSRISPGFPRLTIQAGPCQPRCHAKSGV